MTFVQIGTSTDEMIYLNVDRIIAIQTTGKCRCEVVMTDNHSFYIQMEAQDLVKFIEQRIFNSSRSGD